MEPEMQRIEYGATTIEYALTYAARKTIAISVEPSCRVSVIAPLDTAPELIAERVRRRAPWILRQQRELERYGPPLPPRQYISGETHRYLGRQYRLKVVRAELPAVARSGGWLRVELPDTAPEQVRQALDGWYRQQAALIFPRRLSALLPRFKHYALSAPPLQIKPLVARWGSCSPGGVITLNLRLIHVPKPCIDYVIIHELCHLLEHNHSSRFYRLLDRLLPTWRELRQQLNAVELPA